MYEVDIVSHHNNSINISNTQYNSVQSTMSVSLCRSSNAQNVNTCTTHNVTPSADLSITITVIYKSKPKRRTRYRIVERSDGVIIEQPRYQPEDSPPKEEFKFVKSLFTIGNPPTMKKPSQAIHKQADADLLQIGTFLLDCGRNGYNGPVDNGRDGYNGPADHGNGG